MLYISSKFRDMSSPTYADKISFEKWLINLGEELEVPLGLLNSTLKQLASEETDATKKEQLEIATNLSQRFAGLMHNLNLAALEQTRMALLRISKVKLGRFAQDVVSSFQIPLSNKSEIHLHVNTDVQEAYIDADRLFKILTTLISNSIQFAKESGVRVDVTIDSLSNDSFRITVQDDGIGIVSEKLAHVFNPLYDDDPIHLKLYQSTSAGLYLVLLYVKAMGGNISVESEKMVFTRFTLTLPLIENVEDIPFNNFELVNDSEKYRDSYERRIAFNKDYRTQQHIAFNNTTVLALSSEEVLKGFDSYFNNEIRLMSGQDSALAIARALHLKPDMIILHDGHYGEITSDQVAKTLKSHEITKKVPLVWISENAKLPEADLNIDAGLSSAAIFEKIGDLMNLRKKLIQDLLGEGTVPSTKPKYQNNKEAFLTRLERIVDAHLSRDDLDMDKLSNMLFLNRSQIHRKIKAFTGMNTTEYIRNYKLKLAYRDLKHQSGTVAEIAYRCGFNSPSYFSKSFKEVFGIAPSDVAVGPEQNGNEN